MYGLVDRTRQSLGWRGKIAVRSVPYKTRRTIITRTSPLSVELGGAGDGGSKRQTLPLLRLRRVRRLSRRLAQGADAAERRGQNPGGFQGARRRHAEDARGLHRALRGGRPFRRRHGGLDAGASCVDDLLARHPDLEAQAGRRTARRAMRARPSPTRNGRRGSRITATRTC